MHILFDDGSYLSFFLTKDEQKVEHKTIFKTQEFTCTCEISYGRGNRTL